MFNFFRLSCFSKEKDIEKFVNYLNSYNDFEAHRNNTEEDYRGGEILLFRMIQFSYFLVLHRFKKGDEKNMVLKMYKFFRHFDENGFSKKYYSIEKCGEIVDINSTIKEVKEELDLRVFYWEKDFLFKDEELISIKDKDDLKKLREEILKHIKNKTLFIADKKTRDILSNSLRIFSSSFRDIFCKKEKKIFRFLILKARKFLIKKVPELFLPAFFVAPKEPDLFEQSMGLYEEEEEF